MIPGNLITDDLFDPAKKSLKLWMKRKEGRKREKEKEKEIVAGGT